MREQFGPEILDEDSFGEALLYRQKKIDEVDYQYRRLEEPCPHLLRFWLDNNEKIIVGKLISVLCRKCGGHFVGVFGGYYELGKNFRDEPFILCKACGMRSFHPKDIENRFCGNCRLFLPNHG